MNREVRTIASPQVANHWREQQLNLALQHSYDALVRADKQRRLNAEIEEALRRDVEEHRKLINNWFRPETERLAYELAERDLRIARLEHACTAAAARQATLEAEREELRLTIKRLQQSRAYRFAARLRRIALLFSARR